MQCEDKVGEVNNVEAIQIYIFAIIFIMLQWRPSCWYEDNHVKH